ncbi:50S ribosomal protein L4 [bacterium]|nr:50S ribosomal protein L4 [bacterium]
MATLTVYDRTGKEVDTYEIDPAEIAPHINKQLMHDAVVMYQANRRLGSAKTKTRGQVKGSRQKMYRQKGTGNARAGGRRSGVRRGGGHIFAKKPRDYSYRLPRKALQVATRMALAGKIRDDEVTVIDELSFAEPKTKEMAGIIKALGCGEFSLLVAIGQYDLNVQKSVRNIAKVSVSPVSQRNALSVLAPRRLLVTREALDAIRRHGSAATA